MRRAPTSGPALSFKPDDVLTFGSPTIEHGIEVLQGTIKITNSSSRVVSFRFADDPEYKFSPHESCIAPRSTAIVFATFYNVDGRCEPRRSSVVLRSIRVRDEDKEEVDRLWKRTPPGLISEKRWKFRFEKDQPPSRALPPTPRRKRLALISRAITGADNVKRVGTALVRTAAKTSKAWQSAATRVAECAVGFPRSHLLMALAVMGATLLTGDLALWVVKSRQASEKAYARTTYRAPASKPLLYRVTEGATWLMGSRLPLVVVAVAVCLAALWLKKSGLSPYASNLAHRWVTYGARARKLWLRLATRAVKNASSPLMTSRFLWFIVAAAGVVAMLAALLWLRLLWLAKSKRAQDLEDCVTIGKTKYCF